MVFRAVTLVLHCSTHTFPEFWGLAAYGVRGKLTEHAVGKREYYFSQDLPCQHFEDDNLLRVGINPHGECYFCKLLTMSLIKATTAAIRDSPREIFNRYLFICTWTWSFSGVAKGFDEGKSQYLTTLILREYLLMNIFHR